MFSGDRRYTPSMNPIAEFGAAVDSLVSIVDGYYYQAHAMASGCNKPSCPYNIAVNGPFGNTLEGPSTFGCDISTRGGSILPPGTATRGDTVFPRDTVTRGSSVFPQGTATRGGSVLPSHMNPRAPGHTNAKSRHSGVRGTMTRDWSRADEGRYGRSETGETRAPMESRRRRGRRTGRDLY